MNKIVIARRLAVGSTLALLVLIPAWALSQVPGAERDTRFFISLLILMLPLLLPLYGLLRGKPYTFAWTAFIALFYFTQGVVEAWANADARIAASVEVVLASVLFVSATLYARWRGRQIKEQQAAATAANG